MNGSTQRPLSALVPGGAHTYSKGPDQFPQNAPAAIVRGSGAKVLGDDGRWYTDWGMGLTAVSLGHAQPEVCAAVSDVIQHGVNFIRPSVLEREAAEYFLDVFGVEMVKFCKNSSVATTAAVKLARGYTGRDKIAIAAEHPFFSYDDWFVGSTPAVSGIPDAIQRLTVKFRYNDLASLKALLEEHRGEIAAVVLEPVKFDPPHERYLSGVRQLCTDHGSLLVLDETIAGMKWSIRGGQGYFGVAPDLSVWGKGIANGFSACALAGRRDIMSLGGSRASGPRLFLVSTTHGAESTGLAAMLSTIRIHQRDDVIPDNWRRGAALKQSLLEVVARHGLASDLAVTGYPCLLSFGFTGLTEARALEWKTLLMQELVEEGVLTQGVIYPTPSHTSEICAQTVDAFDKALGRLRVAWDRRSVDGFLRGPALRPVFRSFQECVKSRCGRLHPEEGVEPCCRR